MSQTPLNASHGRDATEKDLLYLKARGLPEHALAGDIKLYQVKKEGANFGKWCWTWGKAFLGFHGQFPKITETGSIEARFNKGKVIPFPNEEDDEKKLGFDRLDVANLLKKRALRLAALEQNTDEDGANHLFAASFQTPEKQPIVPKGTNPPGAPIKVKGEPLKRTHTVAFPPIDDEGSATEDMDEPPSKKQRL